MGRVPEVVAGCVIVAALCGCSNKRDDSNRLVNQALEKVSQNDLSAAKSKLQLAIQSDPGNAAAYHTRAAIYCKEGDIESAIPDFEKAVELSKDNATWRYELAGKYWELYQAKEGDPARDEYLPKIEEHVSRAIELSPTMGEYYLLRARCRKALMEFKGAAEDYRKAIDIDPLQVGSYLELGRLYGLMWKVFYRDDLFALAEQTLSTAEKLQDLPDLPAEAQALLPDMEFELAELYAFRGNIEADKAVQKDFRERAIARFQAIEEGPEGYKDRAQLKLQLAQVFQQNGDLPKACTAAHQAMEGIAGNDPQTAVQRNYLTNLVQEVCVTSNGYDPNR